MSRLPHDIYIAGLGIQTVDHITRETEAVFRRCSEVLYADTGVATHPWLTSLGTKATPLFAESYTPEHPRLDAYHHMAVRVVEAALDHPPVAFGMHGHPTVFCYAPFLIADMAKLLDLSVKVLPGISSMACLFAELMIDPGVNGIFMIEATDMLLRQRPLQPDVPTLIWQVGNLETRLHSTLASRPERFDRFLSYVLRYYPPEHEVVAVYASPHALMPSTVLRFPLGRIAEHARALHAGITLYVPPVSERPIADFDLLQRLDDPEWLRRMTG